MATDIAFALGVLALLGPRVPVGLKVFLTALAIADDLGAVLVIAVFYTERVNLRRAGGGGRAASGCSTWPPGSRCAAYGAYFLLAVAVWAAMLASGVHATVAGILVALTVPVRAGIEPGAFLATLRGKARRAGAGNADPGEHGARPGADGGHRGDRDRHARLPAQRLRDRALPPPVHRLLRAAGLRALQRRGPARRAASRRRSSSRSAWASCSASSSASRSASRSPPSSP